LNLNHNEVPNTHGRLRTRRRTQTLENNQRLTPYQSYQYYLQHRRQGTTACHQNWPFYQTTGHSDQSITH